MDVLDILYKIGYTDLKDHGKEWRTRPLYRASDNNTSLCINKTHGGWYDFSSRQGGHIVQLVKLTMNLPTIAAANDLLGGTHFIDQLPKRNLYELSETQKFDKGLLVQLRQEHNYWLDRGISLTTIKTFQGGITFNGRMAYRYVFPILNEKDELLGFSGRSLTDNPDFPKWKHLGSKSHWSYPFKWNHQAITDTKTVILLESIGDMLALWDNGICNTLVTFGVDISASIIQLLLRLDVERIVIGFNNDEDNGLVGNNAAIAGRRQLMKFFDLDQIDVCLPLSKDFGVMDAEQIALWKTTNRLTSQILSPLPK
jgi:hypothetical protein